MPRVMRRPLSAAAHARPGSVLRTPQRVPDGFAFDDPTPSGGDDVDRRRGLWAQMDLQAHEAPKSASTDSGPDSAPVEAIAIGNASRSATPVSESELAALRAELAKKDEELRTLRAERTEHTAAKASPPASETPAAPHPPGDPNPDPAPSDPAWDQEREQLQARIEELQGAGREAIAVFEHQLDLAAKEQQALRSHVQRLETQLSAKEHGDESVSATDIDLASLREQVAHLTSKHEGLEEELAESREALERAERDAKQHTHDQEAATAAHHDQLRAAQAETQEAKDALARAEQEIARLQETLRAEQTAREHERQDMESLRAAPHDGGEMHAKLAALEAAKKEQEEQHAKEIAELESLVESRIFREDELESEMERLRKERDEAKAALDK